MSERVADLYDLLSADYHAMYADWRSEVLRQGKILDALIRRHLGERQVSVLDCTCGIGTQAIGLATCGYNVYATDLSAVAVQRARREAESFGVDIPFAVTDIRFLDSIVTHTFDVVLSCDNSISHLMDDADLLQAAGQIRGRLKRDGVFLATIRDYDQVIRERQASAGNTTPLPGVTGSGALTRIQPTLPRVFQEPQGQRIVFQIWDWTDDNQSYTLQHFHMQRRHDRWDVQCYTTRYRALLRTDLSRILAQAGFADIVWLMPEESGYYQPVVLARNLGPSVGV
jgi:glycine/sarcosine N-methyltransferase